jgi:hypothetical protein
MSGNAFDALLDIADATIDRHMGEAFDVVPMSAVRNARSVRDLSRPELRGVVGMWDDNATRISAGGAGGAQAHVASSPSVTFRPENLPYAVATYDRVIRRKNGKLYQALGPRPDEQGRVVVPLQEIAPAGGVEG